MFESLKRFIADTAGRTQGDADFADDDYRLAACALLIHVANVDGAIDAAERHRLRDIVHERFGLDAATTSRLIARAEQSDKEAVDFFHFTNVLKHTLDNDGRCKIIEMMWDVAFADGEVTEFEENVVARISELLGVAPRERVTLRRKVAQEPHPASPDPADASSAIPPSFDPADPFPDRVPRGPVPQGPIPQGPWSTGAADRKRD